MYYFQLQEYGSFMFHMRYESDVFVSYEYLQIPYQNAVVAAGIKLEDKNLPSLVTMFLIHCKWPSVSDFTKMRNSDINFGTLNLTRWEENAMAVKVSPMQATCFKF